MKIYISGSITKNPNYREQFREAEASLREEGVEVINPAEIMSTMPESTTHGEYMQIALVLLKQCDAIYMLNGWENSKGALMELNFAIEKKITVIFEGGTVWRDQSAQGQQSLARKNERPL